MHKRRRQEITLNVVTLLVLNVIFWICNYYPKHLLESALPQAILSMVFNLAFFWLYFTVLMIVFTRGKCLFSSYIFESFQPIWKRLHILRILLLLGLQVVMEVLSNLLHSIGQAYLAADLLTLLHWLAVYTVLTYKGDSLWKHKKYWPMVVLILAVATTLCVISDIRIAEHTQFLYEKYTISSSGNVFTDLLTIMGGLDSGALATAVRNPEFYLRLQNLLFDCVLGSTFIIFHRLSIKTEEESSTRPSVLCLRIAILLFAILPLSGIKILICPTNSLQNFQHRATDIENYENDGSFYASSNYFRIMRTNSFSDKREDFAITKTTIYNNGEKVIAFYTDGYTPAIISTMDGNVVIMDDGFTEYKVGGSSVYVYRDMAICFMEGGSPQAIEFKELAKQEKNEILLETCRQLLLNGNLAQFEHITPYLDAHDPDFLAPYLVRYMQEQFTDAEETSLRNCEYQTSYIADIAERYHYG